MRIALLVLIMLLIGSFPFVSDWLHKKNNGSEQRMQKAEMQKLISDHIANNPQEILDSVTNYSKAQMEKEQKEEQAQLENQINKYQDEIVDFSYPSIKSAAANPVTIVEFFDYSCGYCKRAEEIISNTISGNTDVNYIFRSFPMLGAGSELASKFDMAVYRMQPEKYLSFYKKALALNRSEYTEAKLLNLIEEIGINKDAFSAYLKENDANLNNMLQKNLELIRKLGVNGVPTFIVGNKIMPGMINEKDLASALNEARAQIPTQKVSKTSNNTNAAPVKKDEGMVVISPQPESDNATEKQQDVDASKSVAAQAVSKQNQSSIKTKEGDEK